MSYQSVNKYISLVEVTGNIFFCSKTSDFCIDPNPEWFVSKADQPAYNL